MLFFKKKVVEPRKLNYRIAVHCPNGKTVVHYAHERRLAPDGQLTLISATGGVVADYQPGAWVSLSRGKRSVSRSA